MSAHSRSLPRFLQPTASRLHQEEATLRHRKAVSVRANSRPPAMHFGSSTSLARSCTPPPQPMALATTAPSDEKHLVHNHENQYLTEESKMTEMHTNNNTVHKSHNYTEESKDIDKVYDCPTVVQQEVTINDINLRQQEKLAQIRESDSKTYKRARPVVSSSNIELEQDYEHLEKESLQDTNETKDVQIESKETISIDNVKMENEEEEEEETRENFNSDLKQNEIMTENENTKTESRANKELTHAARFDLPCTLHLSRPPPLPRLSAHNEGEEEANNNNNEISDIVINDNDNNKHNNVATFHVEQKEMQNQEEEEQEMLPYSISDVMTPIQNKMLTERQELSSAHSSETHLRSNRWANEFPLPRMTWTTEEVEKLRLSTTPASLLQRAKSTSSGVSPLGSFPTPPSIHEWPRRRSIILESLNNKENHTHILSNSNSNRNEEVTKISMITRSNNVLDDSCCYHANKTSEIEFKENNRNGVKESSHEASPMPTPERFAQSSEVIADKRRCQRPTPMSCSGSIKHSGNFEGSINDNSSDDNDGDHINNHEANGTLSKSKLEEIKEQPSSKVPVNGHAEVNKQTNVTLSSTNVIQIDVSNMLTKQDETDSVVREEVIDVHVTENDYANPNANNTKINDMHDKSSMLVESHDDDDDDVIITSTSELSPIPTTNDLIHSVEASAEKRTCECARPLPTNSEPSSPLEHSSNLARTLSPLPVPAEEHHHHHPVRFVRVAESTESDNNNALIVHPVTSANPISTFNLFESELPQRDHRPSPLSHSSSSKPTDAAFTSPQPEHSYSPSPWPTTEQIISSLHALRALHDARRVAELHSVDNIQYDLEQQEDREEEQHEHQEEQTFAHLEQTEFEEETLTEPHEHNSMEAHVVNTEPNAIQYVDKKVDYSDHSVVGDITTMEDANNNNNNNENEHEPTTIIISNTNENQSQYLPKAQSKARTPSPTPSQHHYEVSLYASSEKRRRKQVAEFHEQQNEEEYEQREEKVEACSIEKENETEATFEEKGTCHFTRELEHVKAERLLCEKKSDISNISIENNDVIDNAAVVMQSSAEVVQDINREKMDDLDAIEFIAETKSKECSNSITDHQLQTYNLCEQLQQVEEPERAESNSTNEEIQPLRDLCEKDSNDHCGKENILQEKHMIVPVASPAFSEAFAESAMFVECLSVPPTPQMAHLPPEYYEMEAHIRALSHSRARHSFSQEQNNKSTICSESQQTHSPIAIIAADTSNADCSVRTTNFDSSNSNTHFVPSKEEQSHKPTDREVCKIDAWAITGPSLLQEMENNIPQAIASTNNDNVKPALETTVTITEESSIHEITCIALKPNGETQHMKESTALQYNVLQQHVEKKEKENEEDPEQKKSAVIVGDMSIESSTHVSGPYLPVSSSLSRASIQTPHIPFTSHPHMPLPLPKSQHAGHVSANTYDCTTHAGNEEQSSIKIMESPLPRPVSLRSQLNEYSPYYVITPHGITNACAPSNRPLVPQSRAIVPSISTSKTSLYHDKVLLDYNHVNTFNNTNNNNNSTTSLAYTMSVSPLPSQRADYIQTTEMPTRRRTPSFVLDPPTPVEKNEICKANYVEKCKEDQEQNNKENEYCSDHEHDLLTESRENKCAKYENETEEVKIKFDSSVNEQATFARSFALSPLANTNATESYGRGSVLLSNNYNLNSEFCSTNLFNLVADENKNENKVNERTQSREMFRSSTDNHLSGQIAENMYKRKREELDESQHCAEDSNLNLHVDSNTTHNATNMKQNKPLSHIYENKATSEISDNKESEEGANVQCKRSTAVLNITRAFPSALYAHRQREQERANLARYNNAAALVSHSNAYCTKSQISTMSSLPLASTEEQEEEEKQELLLGKQESASTSTTMNTLSKPTQSMTSNVRVSAQKEDNSFYEGKRSAHFTACPPENKENCRHSINVQDTPVPKCAIRNVHEQSATHVSEDGNNNTSSNISVNSNNSNNSNNINSIENDVTDESNTRTKKRLRVSTRLSNELRATLFKQSTPDRKEKQEKETKQIRQSTRRSTKDNGRRRSTQQSLHRAKKEPVSVSKRTGTKVSSVLMPSPLVSSSSSSSSTRQRASRTINEARDANKRNSVKSKFVEENCVAHGVSKLTNHSNEEANTNKRKVIKKGRVSKRRKRDK